MTPLELLKKLISIPSVNPMGRPLQGPEFFEQRMSDFLVGFFKQLGLTHERIEVVPGRDNVVAYLPGSAGLPTVLFDAHQDTVPTDDMTIDPFAPIVRGGRIQGRGACDVKGGMAAMLRALERLVQERPANHPSVVMACTCDEEHDELGVIEMIRLHRDGHQGKAGYLTEPPDLAVVAEPTELHVVAAHRGATRWKIRTTGRAAHSSDPSQGVNAIYQMAQVVQRLEEYAAELQEESEQHPLCGSSTLSVGRIEGGVSVNVVPAECTVEIDRRVVPGEDGSKVMQHVEEFLRQELAVDFEMLPPWMIGVPLPSTENSAVRERLLRAARSVVESSQIVGAAYGTHAARYAAAGVPSVVFGPGSVAQAHTKDEWLDIEQLEQASEIYYRFLASW